MRSKLIALSISIMIIFSQVSFNSSAAESTHSSISITNLKEAILIYGISTQEDVSSQVGYSHKTIGLGKPTVSASSSGALGFSIGIAGSKSDYLGRSFTLYYGQQYK